MKPQIVLFLIVFIVTVTLASHTGYGSDWDFTEKIFGEP
jgi:hypothetical protein